MTQVALEFTDEKERSLFVQAMASMGNVQRALDPDCSDGVVTDRKEEGMACLQRGKPVLWMGDWANSLDLMDKAANHSESRFMPGHLWRFRPDVLVMRRSLEREELGRPGLLRIHRWESARSGFDSSWDWVLPEMDLVRWVFGEMPDTLRAWRRDVAGGTYLQVHGGYDHGGMFLVDCAWILPRGDGYGSLSVIGSNGAAYGDDHHNMQLLYGGDSPRALKTPGAGAERGAMLKEFIRSLEEGNAFPVLPADTMAARMMAQAAVESTMRELTACRKEGGYEFR